MNRIKKLFSDKKKNIVSIYFTAGFPELNDTNTILNVLQKHGADLIEIGMPYSDPLADGPVIQHSSMKALQNGMSIKLLFDQLNKYSNSPSGVKAPLILMGYLNPVLQYGIEKFCSDAHKAGIDGIILPDLPLHEYEIEYKNIFEKYKLDFIFLITPETSEKRIRKIDALSKGFIYAVSSSSITGSDKDMSAQEEYFQRLRDMKLNNPILIGFGIKDNKTFLQACKHAAGAIIGTAYIKAIENSNDIEADTEKFLNSILGATIAS
ncbi:tryptophan synthase subunit alpha [Ginsengibacter hankyongi]|uniref:Tryptophan synthase alpha chain n=2 Tax=Ginsengibacter hankyongi TaxID=2607284 RepID=A0A5J5INF3_9BACT|nr:tryptophan synthase subunit alpha [Ginsengibacter hankyongi]